MLQLDDRKAQAELDVAEAKYEAAKTKAEADDINVRYAKAAAAVAKAEYEVNLKANADVPGSVPQVRLNELLLKCTETELAIEKAKLDQKVADEEAKVAKAEVEAAKVMVERHKVVSPIAGVVVDIRAHKGEAVQPAQAGDPRRQARQPVGRRQRARRQVRAGRTGGQNVTVDVAITRGEKTIASRQSHFREAAHRYGRHLPGPRQGRRTQSRTAPGCSVRACRPK